MFFIHIAIFLLPSSTSLTLSLSPSQSESGIIEPDSGQLAAIFVDYIDGARQYLEGENDRDLPILQEIRLHFGGFVTHLISNTPSKLCMGLVCLAVSLCIFTFSSATNVTDS